MNYALLIAAVFGLTSVFLGAYGDHSLQTQLDTSNWQSWSTALRYHQLYSLVLLVFAGFRWLPIGKIGQMWVTAIVLFFSIGIILFCGSIYLRILTDFSELSWLTPMGGVFLMSSWLLVIMFAFSFRQKDSE